MNKRTADWLSDLAHAEEEHILQTTTGFYLDDFPELAVDELNRDLEEDDAEERIAEMEKEAERLERLCAELPEFW